MPYAKGTATPINADRKTTRRNPARVGGIAMPTTGIHVPHRLTVARKPAKNKAAK